MAKTTAGTLTFGQAGPKDSKSTPKQKGLPEFKLKQPFTPEYRDAKKESFIQSDPERVFNKAKTMNVFRKEGAEVQTEDLQKVLNMNINGGTIREWVESLPKEERTEYYRQPGREYLSATREPVAKGTLQYIKNSLIGAGIADAVSHLALPLAVFGARAIGRPILKLTPQMTTAIHMATAAAGAGVGAAVTPAIIKKQVKERKKGYQFATELLREKTAESKSISKAVEESYEGRKEPEIRNLRKEQTARQIVEDVKDQYLQERAKVETAAYPLAGAAALGAAITEYVSSRAKDNPDDVFNAIDKYLARHGIKDIQVEVTKGMIDPSFVFKKKGLSGIRTSPDLAYGLHEAGHAKEYLAHPKRAGIVSALSYSPETVVRNIPIAATDNPYLVSMAKRAVLPRVIRPATAMPFWAIAGLGVMSESAQKALGGFNPSTRKKVVKYLGEHPELIAAAGTMPLLTEEAVASGRAVKELARTKGVKTAIRGAGKLSLPFTTYLAGAAATVMGVKSIGDYLEKKRRLKRLKEPPK
jgi:hypothetical protein